MNQCMMSRVDDVTVFITKCHNFIFMYGYCQVTLVMYTVTYTGIYGNPLVIKYVLIVLFIAFL